MHPVRQVPAYDIQELAPKRTRYCVAIAVINEGERIRRQLVHMKSLKLPYDLIIADGGSTDGSVAPDFLAAQGVRALLTKRGPGKLGAQIRMAFDFALNQGYDGIVFIDGNDKDDPAAIPSFVEALEQGFDFVQGSRFVPGGKAVNTPLARWVGIQLVHAPLISLSAGFRYTDTTNGFRGYSARLLRDERMAVFRDVFIGYELHFYIAIRAARLGMRVRELPVTRAYPKSGKIPTKISPLKGNLTVLMNLFQACLRRFDPPAGGGSR